MKTGAKLIIIALLIVGGSVILNTGQAPFGAASETGEPPVRQTEIIVSYTEYHWWLTRWEDNAILCVIPVDHEGWPGFSEVLGACGETLYDEWASTPPCEEAIDAEGQTQACEGLYLFMADAVPKERTVVIDLPVPSVWLTLSGCTPAPPENQCSIIPALFFTAEEPLPNEQITAIHVQIQDDIYVCPGAECEIPMETTNIEGEQITFWAVSSYGDESEHFQARVRIVDGGLSDPPGESVWYVDVLSNQWRGSAISSCAATWEAFPPLGGPPPWLSTPEKFEEMETDVGFLYLAGQLIEKGIVDASDCPRNGLLGNGAANPCGLERSRTLVNEWQDQFDNTILQVSEETSIPAQLMKNLFAQESQFWPGVIISDEFGLGQLTSQGADAPLLWNASFFNQFCPLVLHESECAKGYAHLDETSQAMLRGALATRTDASCVDCELGIDLEHAEFSIDLFAQTLLGNCEQVAYIVYDTTNQTPGLVSTYEDLWRFTLVNYNAGPGCLITALQTTWRQEEDLSWDLVAEHVSEGCQNAITYVERVARDNVIGFPDFVPTPTPRLPPGSGGGGNPYPAPTEAGTPTITPPDGSATPTPTGTPPTATPTATSTSTPTPTTEAYP